MIKDQKRSDPSKEIEEERSQRDNGVLKAK
jgi:hypothetical protein